MLNKFVIKIRTQSIQRSKNGTLKVKVKLISAKDMKGINAYECVKNLLKDLTLQSFTAATHRRRIINFEELECYFSYGILEKTYGYELKMRFH